LLAVALLMGSVTKGREWSLTKAELFERPKTRPAWTTTRSAVSTPGTGTSPWRCSRTPISPSPPRTPQKPGRPGRLAPAEIRRLLTHLTTTITRPLDFALAWSARRRRDQTRARSSHYWKRWLKHHEIRL